MPFQIIHNNIINMTTDAIVNAANSKLKQGGGVCGAIFEAAGAEELQRACDKMAPCPVGKAVVTKGFSMKTKYIIHAVGPIWYGGHEQEELYLRSAYKSALKAAKEKKCKSISFPLISAGIYGYPREQALEIAVSVFRQFLKKEEMDIYLVVFDRNAVSISEKLYKDVQHYIDCYSPSADYQERIKLNTETYQLFDKDTIKEEREAGIYGQLPTFSMPDFSEQSDVDFKEESKCYEKRKSISIGRSLQQLLGKKEETFAEMLFRLIDEKGYTDVEVYKRANMDRKLFSKIRSNKNYCPRKQNVLSLAIALKLSLDETLDLLNRAGYSLSVSNKSDIIIRYFLENGEYDIFLINETLFAFQQNPL